MRSSFLGGFFLLLSYLPQKLFGQELPGVGTVEYLAPFNLPGLYPDRTDLEKIEKGLLLVKDFLQNAFLPAGPDAAVTRSMVGVILEGVTPKNLFFEIIGVDPGITDTLVFSVNVYWQFNNGAIKLFKGSVKVGANLKDDSVVFPLYNSGYASIAYPNVRFIVNKDREAACRSNMERASTFLADIVQFLKARYPKFKAPLEPLQYVIAEGYFSAFEYYSFYNYVSTSRFLRSDNTIIDVLAKGFYKHELMHYVFSNYEFNYFLSEGLATLFSDGEPRYGSVLTTDWSAMKQKIKTDKAFARALNSKDSLFNRRYAPEMYAIAATMICRYKEKVGEQKFYPAVFEKLVHLSEDELFGFLKAELGIKKVAAFVEETTLPVYRWLPAGK